MSSHKLLAQLAPELFALAALAHGAPKTASALECCVYLLTCGIAVIAVRRLAR